MRRPFLKNKSALLPILGLAALIFAVPHFAHAGLVEELVTGGIGTLFEVLFLPLASAILALSGMLLDSAIAFSLHTAYIFSLSPAINLGWTIVRDLCNIFFIFVLIYISLGTIVRGTSFGTKSLLTKVIIAALLINFSLFFTKAVVDVSNVFGLWLYGGITNTLRANTGAATLAKGEIASLSDLISARLGIVQWWRLTTGGSESTRNASEAAEYLKDPSNSFIARILRLAIVMIAIYIFIYCAILFISRSVTLLFLLVFSPVGFMGEVLPQLSEYSKDWKKELTSAVMFPIAFLLMLYISLQFINSLKVLNLAALTDNTKAPLVGGISISLYFQYFIIIFMLQACLSVAKDNSGKMGKAVGGLADGLGKLAVNAVGTYATGGVSMGLRALGRGAGAALSAEKGAGWSAFSKTAKENIHPFFTEGKALKYFKKGGGALLAKDGKEQLTNTMKSGTWDVRNAKIPFVPGTSVGNALTRGIDATGVTIEGADKKDIKEATAEYAEMRKVSKAEVAIFAEMEGDLKEMTRVFNLSALKDAAAKAPIGAGGDVARAAYVSAVKAYNDHPDVKAAKSRISDETQKLGNKQLEKLNKGILKNEQFIQTISQSQAEHLADKAETDEDKAKVWSARLSDVTTTVKNNADFREVKKAIKSHSDKELQNLPADILKNKAFVNPKAMDYDKFDKLMKSDKLTGSTKAEMKKARYEDFDRAVASGIEADIDTEMKKLEEGEIAKLGWKDNPTDPDKRLSHPHVIHRLTPKTLGKVLDELSSDERDTIKDEINNAPVHGDPKVQENIVKVRDWFTNNQVGKTF